MIPRILHISFLLAIPAILLGQESGKLRYKFKPDIPDTVKGIQIQFEVKEVKVLHQDGEVYAYYLCADITNQNDRPEKILVRYQCQGQEKTKEIVIGERQQRIILVDKCITPEQNPADLRDFYSLVLLEYRK